MQNPVDGQKLSALVQLDKQKTNVYDEDHICLSILHKTGIMR